MSAEKIAHRYAMALLGLTQGQQDLQDKIISDLREMSRLYQDKAIRRIIASPIVSRELLEAVFANMTNQLSSSDLLKRTIGMLIENKRTLILPELTLSFEREVMKQRGIVEAVLTSAVQLEEAEIEGIKARFEKLFQKKIILTQKVEKSVLGGFVVRIENSVLDLSLKTKLENMTQFAVS